MEAKAFRKEYKRMGECVMEDIITAIWSWKVLIVFLIVLGAVFCYLYRKDVEIP